MEAFHKSIMPNSKKQNNLYTKIYINPPNTELPPTQSSSLCNLTQYLLLHLCVSFWGLWWSPGEVTLTQFQTKFSKDLQSTRFCAKYDVICSFRATSKIIAKQDKVQKVSISIKQNVFDTHDRFS